MTGDTVFYYMALGGAILVLLYGGIQIWRRFPRVKTTRGSNKWGLGHNAGCAMNAPDGVCICERFINRSKD